MAGRGEGDGRRSAIETIGNKEVSTAGDLGLSGGVVVAWRGTRWRSSDGWVLLLLDGECHQDFILFLLFLIFFSFFIFYLI